MDSLTLHRVLVALTWLLLTLLILFLWLLARFFERLSAKRTYYRSLLVPIALFTVTVIQVIVTPEGTPIAYGTAFAGGLWLSAFCLSLYRKMTRR
ncbi:MAG: hypothetical protein CUN51_00200 [Candidatus Thermofonsia Clade 1 bacterium]|uniref:Uncharacterized protein n=1 Tax=Candidatus Thermofonsia Clade 1 bacterium TaxID=2364210 RepID=A0A2M8P3G1_9CHLR|nr:MAG: hypothetical protein CUN51_00200 [Candidatus Thermofonsia Clade 1 bacterium]